LGWGGVIFEALSYGYLLVWFTFTLSLRVLQLMLRMNFVTLSHSQYGMQSVSDLPVIAFPLTMLRAFVKYSAGSETTFIYNVTGYWEEL
jgi:hypothetical protein